MDVRHARTFVTVADLGTVSKAAQRLRVAQPALSRQISNLEQELGLKLFDRMGRRLVLTGEGEQLLSDCRGLLSSAAALSERAQLLRRGDTGVLKVAASPHTIESVFSGFLHRYAKHFPDVDVRLIEASGAENLALLDRGEVHLGQNLAHAVQPGDDRFASYPLEWSNSCRFPIPTDAWGGWSNRYSPPRAVSFLLLDRAFAVRRTFDAACRLARLEPNVRFESRAPYTLLAMAEAGHGVAVVTSAVRTQPYALQIVRVTYRGKPLREPLTVFWDKRRSLPRYASAFCQMLAEYMREVFPITSPSERKPRARTSPASERRARGVGTR